MIDRRGAPKKSPGQVGNGLRLPLVHSGAGMFRHRRQQFARLHPKPSKRPVGVEQSETRMLTHTRSRPLRKTRLPPVPLPYYLSWQLLQRCTNNRNRTSRGPLVLMKPQSSQSCRTRGGSRRSAGRSLGGCAPPRRPQRPAAAQAVRSSDWRTTRPSCSDRRLAASQRHASCWYGVLFHACSVVLQQHQGTAGLWGPMRWGLDAARSSMCGGNRKNTEGAHSETMTGPLQDDGTTHAAGCSRFHRVNASTQQRKGSEAGVQQLQWDAGQSLPSWRGSERCPCPPR